MQLKENKSWMSPREPFTRGREHVVEAKLPRLFWWCQRLLKINSNKIKESRKDSRNHEDLRKDSRYARTSR